MLMSLCCWGGGVVGYSADVFVLLGGTVLMSVLLGVTVLMSLRCWRYIADVFVLLWGIPLMSLCCWGVYC